MRGLAAEILVRRRSLDVEASFFVPSGGRLVLFGPSGAGKTTILEAIAGLVPIAAGQVALNGCILSERGTRFRSGIRVRPSERRIGLLRQEPALFPHMSVRANIAYSHGERASARSERVAELAEMLHIGHLLDAHPSALSGGERQRVAVARVLASPFEALLLDEPYSGLDSSLRRELSALMASEARARLAPLLLVTHDLEEALSFADHLGVLDAGRLLQIGEPSDVVRRPATRRVASLLGYSAFISLDRFFDPADPLKAPGRIASTDPPRLLVGLHPHGMTISDKHAASPCVIPPASARARHLALDALVTGTTRKGLLACAQVLVAGEAPFEVPLPPGTSGYETDTSVTILADDPPLFDMAGHAVPLIPPRA
jgi:iron(III) transport system ATP-binding protein